MAKNSENKKLGDKILLKQIRSSIGREKYQKSTLRALGLGRIGQSQEHYLTPMVRGMIKSVSHLVEISKVN